MPDINASLKTTINGKGPQHKMHRVNEFEFTEGSDGALHTKIVDKNGNPIDSSQTEVSNLPNDYPDSAVRQELESVKAELQSLKEHTFNTQLTGSNVDKDNAVYTSTVEEYRLETLWDGEVLEPSTSRTIPLGASNERAVYLFISADKPNWTLRGRTLFSRLNHETVFPIYDNHDSSYTANEPALAFLLGIRPGAQGLENPTTLEEARALRMPISSNEYVQISNQNTEPSTFAVKVLRIW